MKAVVGDGRQTSLFYDNWLPNGALVQRLNVDVSIWGQNLTVHQWTNGNGNWNIPLSFKRRFPTIANEISGMKITTLPDRYVWKSSTSSNFYIASYYDNIRRRNPKVPWYRLVWAGRIPEKCKFITWLLLHQRLKTRMFLTARGLNIDIVCPLCNSASESCQHIFFGCKFAKEVWKKTLATHGISRNPSMWGNELRWLKTNCKGRNVRAKLIRVLFSCTVYMIWWERNKRIFAQESHNPLEVFEGISNFFRLIL